MRHRLPWRAGRMPLAAGSTGTAGLEVLIHAAGDADGRAGDVRHSQRPSALPARRPTRYGEEQAETAGFLACRGMLHKYLAAALISSWPGKIFTKRPHPWAAY